MTLAHNDPKGYPMTHAERESREAGPKNLPKGGSAAVVPAALLACKACLGTEWTLDEATAEKVVCRYCTSPQGPAPAGIRTHEGNKYLRTIRSCLGEPPVGVDVYAVLKAFGVACPATAHAVKKLLCAGARGKGDRRADIVGAQAALARALELLDEEETK